VLVDVDEIDGYHMKFSASLILRLRLTSRSSLALLLAVGLAISLFALTGCKPQKRVLLRDKVIRVTGECKTRQGAIDYIGLEPGDYCSPGVTYSIPRDMSQAKLNGETLCVWMDDERLIAISYGANDCPIKVWERRPDQEDRNRVKVPSPDMN
jgi:hypothetical protein